MRLVVLDTETTGLEPGEGHRIIEIGCVELLHRRPADEYQQYLNPGVEIDDGAYEVHGITNQELADKPPFSNVAREFIDFVKDSELIIHNAPFDVGFINAELQRLGSDWGKIEDYCTITDSLALAKQKHPGQKNGLDALCKRYQIDNSARERHGALIDARLLAEVYLLMTGGQAALPLQEHIGAADIETVAEVLKKIGARPPVIQPGSDELEAHRHKLNMIDQRSAGKCIWKRLEE